MRIERFGDVYASAYTFDKELMRDKWRSMRPPVTAEVSGANGVFDFYGSNNYPIAPYKARKRFAISASSEAAIEDDLDELRGNTISAERSKLWWLDRDGSTTYWSWAKCVSLNTADTYREEGKWLKNVDIEFFAPEGVWYGSASSNDTFTFSGSSFRDESITTAGNLPSLLKTTVTPSGGTATVIEIWVESGADIVCAWRFSENVSTGNDLIVDATNYTVTNDEADAYSGLILGDDIKVSYDPQIVFLHFSGTSQLINGELTGTATGTCFVEWWDRYVF